MEPRLAIVDLRRSAPPASGGDVALLAFLLAVHAAPLVALAAGRSWGASFTGWATAILLVGGRELARELRALRR